MKTMPLLRPNAGPSNNTFPGVHIVQLLRRYISRSAPFIQRSQMSLFPLFRFNSRARSTSLGIALCTMFIVASFSVAGGLRTSMDRLEGNFSSDYSLITEKAVQGPPLFMPSEIQPVLSKSALGIFSIEHVYTAGESVTLFSVEDPNHVLPETISTTGNNVLAGTSLDLSGNLLVGDARINLTVTGHFSSTIFPAHWLLCSWELMQEFTYRSGYVNFAIGRALTSAESADLQKSGFVVQPMIGIIPFLDSGVKSIESDAYWVLIPSSFVIAVLAYSFIGVETADRRHDIGIMKTIGAGRKRIIAYLLGNALLLSVWGALLGIALGIVLAYAVSTAASAMFSSVFIIRPDAWLLLLSFIATVTSGMIGSLLPALRMTLSTPVKDLKEVTRYS